MAIGRSCGAYRTILTHFSQRYPRLPPGLDMEAAATAAIAVAFDGMRVPLTSLPDLPQLLPVLQHAWGEAAVLEHAGSQALGRMLHFILGCFISS